MNYEGQFVQRACEKLLSIRICSEFTSVHSVTVRTRLLENTTYGYSSLRRSIWVRMTVRSGSAEMPSAARARAMISRNCVTYRWKRRRRSG